MISRIKKRHIALLTLLALLGTATIFYLQNDQQKDSSKIRAYDEVKDFVPLVKLINDNQFWLSETSDLAPERLLKWRAPHHDPTKKGQAKFSVIEEEGKLGGFIAFHKESLRHGFIWLVAVDKDFRGRGFGGKLMKHALNKLKKQNAKYVTIATRTINAPAIALYNKMGFVEKSRSEERGIVTLILRDL